MMEEVKDIDRKLIIPAKLARDSLKPMKKAIKKREDAKVCSNPSCDTPSADASHRLTTSVTRAAARRYKTKRLAPTATTSPLTSTKSTSNVPHTHTSSQTRTSVTGYLSSMQPPFPSCPICWPTRSYCRTTSSATCTPSCTSTPTSRATQTRRPSQKKSYHYGTRASHHCERRWSPSSVCSRRAKQSSSPCDCPTKERH
jgi:hypothetical protein